MECALRWEDWRVSCLAKAVPIMIRSSPRWRSRVLLLRTSALLLSVLRDVITVGTLMPSHRSDVCMKRCRHGGRVSTAGVAAAGRKGQKEEATKSGRDSGSTEPVAVIDWLTREALIDEFTFNVPFHPIMLSVCLPHGCVLTRTCACVFVRVSPWVHTPGPLQRGVLSYWLIVIDNWLLQWLVFVLHLAGGDLVVKDTFPQ